MKRIAVLGAAVLCGGAAPAPVANYWMDVATSSGFGAGMSAQPSMSQVMNMMNGGGSAVGHTCWHLLRSECAARWRKIFGPAILLMLAAAVGLAFNKTYRAAHKATIELAELVPAALGSVGVGIWAALQG